MQFLGIRGELLLAVALVIRVVPSGVSTLCLLTGCLRFVRAPLHLLLNSALFGCLWGQLAGLELRWWWYPCVEDIGIRGWHRRRRGRL